MTMVEAPHGESPLYMWELLKVSHHPTKFGDHRHLDIGDIRSMKFNEIIIPNAEKKYVSLNN